MWLHGQQYGALGRTLFAFIWFTVLLMPVLMLAASCGLLGMYLIHAQRAWELTRGLWVFHAVSTSLSR